MNACPCGSVHGADEVIARGRFNPNATTYQARDRATPARSTRPEAMRDACPAWAPNERTTS